MRRSRASLQFGYAKTSLDDIAKRANLSRPLLYRKYKNKEDIYGAVYDDVFEARYPIAEEILAGRGSRRDKLFRIYEVLCVETWALVMGAPMAPGVLRRVHAGDARRSTRSTSASWSS